VARACADRVALILSADVLVEPHGETGLLDGRDDTAGVAVITRLDDQPDRRFPREPAEISTGLDNPDEGSQDRA